MNDKYEYKIDFFDFLERNFVPGVLTKRSLLSLFLTHKQCCICKKNMKWRQDCIKYKSKKPLDNGHVFLDRYMCTECKMMELL